jgi:hypothetical protein
MATIQVGAEPRTAATRWSTTSSYMCSQRSRRLKPNRKIWPDLRNQAAAGFFAHSVHLHNALYHNTIRHSDVCAAAPLLDPGVILNRTRSHWRPNAITKAVQCAAERHGLSDARPLGCLRRAANMARAVLQRNWAAVVISRAGDTGR